MKRIFGFLFVLLIAVTSFAAEPNDEPTCVGPNGCGTAFPVCNNNTFTVQYSCGDGTGAITETQSCTYDDTNAETKCFAKSGDSCTPPTDKKFVRWKCSSTGEGGCSFENYEVGADISKITEENGVDVTLTADYIEADVVNITIKTAGGEIINDKFAKTQNGYTTTCTTTGDEIEIPNPERPNSSFSYWIVDGNTVESLPMQLNASRYCKKDVDIQAYWECDPHYHSNEEETACDPDEITIRYDTAGGSTVDATTCLYGETLTINTIPTKTGYDFKGWYYKGTDEKVSDLTCGLKGMSDNTIELNAKWSPKESNVTLSCGDGIADNTERTFIYDQKIKMPGSDFCVKTGYSLTAWKIETNDGIYEKRPNEDITWTYIGDATITAQWSPNQYTVNYYCAVDGDVAKTQNATYDTEYNHPTDVCAPAKGYKFVGWKNENDKIISSPFIWKNDGNDNYYAEFQAISYECFAGQYLPAGATECTSCSYEAYCTGDTFEYSANEDQGLTACPTPVNNNPMGALSSDFMGTEIMTGDSVRDSVDDCKVLYTFGSLDLSDPSELKGENERGFYAVFCGYDELTGNYTSDCYGALGYCYNGYYSELKSELIREENEPMDGYVYHGATLQNVVNNVCKPVGQNYYSFGALSCYSLPEDQQEQCSLDLLAQIGCSEGDIECILDAMSVRHQCPDGGKTNTDTAGSSADCYKTGLSCAVENGNGEQTCNYNKDSSQYDLNCTTCDVTQCDTGYIVNGDACAPLTYTVKYNANGGTGTMSNVTHTYDVEKALTNNAFTNGTKQFLGWSTSSSATSATYTNGQSVYNLSTTNDSTVNLYAVWGDCASCAAGTGATCELSAPLGVCTYVGACKTGYNTLVGGDTTTPSCTANTYTVSFNANGGTGGQSANVTATYDAEMPVISTTAPTRTGYTFVGWYDNADYASGTQYYSETGASARTWNKTANTTLYAGWTKNGYDCKSGEYLNVTSCKVCESGYYCPNGAMTYTYNGKIQGRSSCPSGYADGGTGLTTQAQCVMSVPGGGYVATANAELPALCMEGTYKAAHAVNYGQTSSCEMCSNWSYSGEGAASCTSCPSVTSGWSKTDSTSTGWKSYTSCKQTQIPANCTSGSVTQTAISSTQWGTSVVTTALTANANHYVADTVCVACKDGFLSPENNTGDMSSCKKTIVRICEYSSSDCPENSTCDYDMGHTESIIVSQGTTTGLPPQTLYCPLVDFTCNDGYRKTADGSACEPGMFKVIYHLGGGTNYDGAPTEFDASVGVIISGKPTKAGYEFIGWSLFEDMTHPSNGITVKPEAATGDLHVWAKWSACPSGYYCDGDKHQCPETHPESAPQSDKLSDCYQVCETHETDGYMIQEPVNATEYYNFKCSYREPICRAGYEMIGGVCHKCARDNALTYSRGCEIESCVSGYHPNGDKCDSDIVSCSVSHAVSAVQKWNSVKKAYDKCMIAECDDGYHIDANACVPDEESCEIANGTGVREWNHRTNSWGECIATRCDPGYTNDASQTNEAWNQCGRCNNAYSAGGELAASSYVRECEIASCLYQGELYALENNECRLICDEYSDETGRRYWDSSRKKCAQECADGYTSW